MANPIVLITGANTGLGYETVKALCQSASGYRIILCGRELQKAQGAVMKIQEECPTTKSDLTAIQLDIEDDLSIENLVHNVDKTFGKIDVLINNAGTALFIDLSVHPIQ
jgi:NAD(P)-dependent dehydrogenase (short-subunit alcohol dehydrogenase family)